MDRSTHQELWAYLESLRLGEILTGRVAAIERFGVFVALDEGPAHPLFPGVGFITVPELSWHRIEAVEEVVEVGQSVACEFLQFDDWNLEARLSLRALRPDPLKEFADRTPVGTRLQGRVTKLLPFGAFVRVADGIEGLVHLTELAWTPVDDPVDNPEDIVRVDDEITVVVTEIDLERRRLALSLRQATPPG